MARISNFSIYFKNHIVYSLDLPFEAQDINRKGSKPTGFSNHSTSKKDIENNHMIISTLIQLSNEFSDDLKLIRQSRSTTVVLQRNGYYFTLGVANSNFAKHGESFYQLCDLYLEGLLNRVCARISMFSDCADCLTPTSLITESPINDVDETINSIVNERTESALLNMFKSVEYPYFGGMYFTKASIRPIVGLKSQLDLDLQIVIYYKNCVIYSDLDLQDITALNDYVCDPNSGVIDDFVINQIKDRDTPIIESDVTNSRFTGYLVGPLQEHESYSAKIVSLGKTAQELLIYQFESRITTCLVGKPKRRIYMQFEEKIRQCSEAILANVQFRSESAASKIKNCEYLEFDILTSMLDSGGNVDSPTARARFYELETSMRDGDASQIWIRDCEYDWSVGIKNGSRKVYFGINGPKSLSEAQCTLN